MKPRANNPGLFVGGKQCSVIAIVDNLNLQTEPDVGAIWIMAAARILNDLEGLSERSRKILLGHSTKGDTTLGYGPRRITEEQANVVQKLSSKVVFRLTLIRI
jgi:hypothetical protein